MKRLLFAFMSITLMWAAEPEHPPASTLATLKRVYVEQLGGGGTSDQMRDMIIAALQSSGMFGVTENQDRADATVKGSADDRVFTEEHQTSDSIGVHSSVESGSSAGNVMAGTESSHRGVNAGITDSENSRIQDRRHEASASIRIVNADGDIIWSSTQESSGGKFRGAMADVADKIVRQLTADIRKAKEAPLTTPPPAKPRP